MTFYTNLQYGKTKILLRLNLCATMQNLLIIEHMFCLDNYILEKLLFVETTTVNNT